MFHFITWKTTCKLTVDYKTVRSSMTAVRMSADDLVFLPCGGVAQGTVFTKPVVFQTDVEQSTTSSMGSRAGSTESKKLAMQSSVQHRFPDKHPQLTGMLCLLQEEVGLVLFT